MQAVLVVQAFVYVLQLHGSPGKRICYVTKGLRDYYYTSLRTYPCDLPRISNSCSTYENWSVEILTTATKVSFFSLCCETEGAIVNNFARVFTVSWHVESDRRTWTLVKKQMNLTSYECKETSPKYAFPAKQKSW